MNTALSRPLAVMALVGSTAALALGACSDDDGKASTTGGRGGSSTSAGAGGSGSGGGAATGGGGHGAGGGYSSLPQAVMVAGYTNRTFSSTFTDKTVDTKLTKNEGFQWYPYDLFGAPTELERIVLEDDESVTLKGSTSGPNGEIATGVWTGGTTFMGTAFGGGAYFEAVLSFDPADVAEAGYAGVPAWWSYPIDFILQSDDTYWNGTKTGNYDHHIEPDFFEYNVQDVNTPPPVERYSGTFHDWYGVRNVTCKGECDWHASKDVNHRDAPAGTDWKQPTSVGFLWVPATDGQQGSATFYVNGVPAGPPVKWDKWQNTDPPNPPVDPNGPQPPWGVSWMDHEHYLLVLGTGENEPMNVERVDVWQKTTDGNLVGKGP
jgi:hypothetical protein